VHQHVVVRPPLDGHAGSLGHGAQGGPCGEQTLHPRLGVRLPVPLHQEVLSGEVEQGVALDEVVEGGEGRCVPLVEADHDGAVRQDGRAQAVRRVGEHGVVELHVRVPRLGVEGRAEDDSRLEQRAVVGQAEVADLRAPQDLYGAVTAAASVSIERLVARTSGG
jgi:hypothetical protein